MAKYVTAIIIAFVLAGAILGAALIMRPEPTPAEPTDPSAVYRAAEIACLEGGGSWHKLESFCEH